MNPPKRQVFVDSFYFFEEPNRRGTHKKSTTPPQGNHQETQGQPEEGHASTRGPTQEAEGEGRADTSRGGSQAGETTRVRTPEGPNSRAQGTKTPQYPGKKGQGQASGHLCRMRGSPPSRTRPAARTALSATGSTQGKPSKELPSRRNKPPDKPASSDDNPGPGPRTLVPAHNRGKQARWNLFMSTERS